MVNDKKYKDANYPCRRITELKELIYSSERLFADKPAFYQKRVKGGEYEAISYTETVRMMRALGTRLTDMELSGKKIGVIGESRFYWVLTYFTVVCGVGVIVPLDKNLPDGELQGLIERAGLSAIVYSDSCRKKVRHMMELSESPVEVFVSMDEKTHAGEGRYSLEKLIEEGQQLLDAGDERYVNVDIDPDQMSTLLFTSGTTGAAKGVMLSHRNLATNVMQLSAYFNVPEPKIGLSILPLHHVYEMTCDVWTSFYQGASIAFCEGLKYIQKNMKEIHPTVMLGVPLVFEKFYKGMWKQAKKSGEEEKLRNAIDLSKRLKLYRSPAIVKRMFKSVHDSFGGRISFIEGGAAADPFIIEEFEAMGIPLIQGYGMSECAPIIALNRDRYRMAGPVGQPVQDADVRVINQDEDGIGEVIVKSDSVMMGYFEDPEATAEVIRDGWLHTGDLGYFDSDGFLYLTGRSKTVIVTKGGKNIFPEEVEQVFEKNPFISEVLVYGTEDEHVGNVIITAEIYPDFEALKKEKGEMVSSEIYHFYKDLADQINEEMPPYKAVRRVRIRDTEFIKTTSGKIKRYGNRSETAISEELDEERPVGYRDLKKKEQRQASEFSRKIRKSQDPAILHKDVRAVSDARELMSGSCDRFGKNVWYHGKDGSQVTYQQVWSDVVGLGTAMWNRGISGVTAILGDPGQMLLTGLMTVLAGTGTAFLADVEEEPAALAWQLRSTGTETVMTDEAHLPLLAKAIAENETNVRRILFCGGPAAIAGAGTALPAETEVLYWEQLAAEGKDQAAQGDRQFLDAEVSAANDALIVYPEELRSKVVLSHWNLAETIMAAASLVSYEADDVAVLCTPMHNLFGLYMSVLMPFYKGASVMEAAEEPAADCKPTILAADSTYIDRLVESITEGTEKKLSGVFRHRGRIRKNLRGIFGKELRMMIRGGEFYDPDMRRLLKDLKILPVASALTPDKTSIIAMQPDKQQLIRPDSVGHLLPGVRVNVVTKDGEQDGEVLVKGGSLNHSGKSGEDRWISAEFSGKLDEDDFLYIR